MDRSRHELAVAPVAPAATRALVLAGFRRLTVAIKRDGRDVSAADRAAESALHPVAAAHFLDKAIRGEEPGGSIDVAHRARLGGDAMQPLLVAADTLDDATENPVDPPNSAGPIPTVTEAGGAVATLAGERSAIAFDGSPVNANHHLRLEALVQAANWRNVSL